MPLPKKLQPRVEKFVQIVLDKVVSGKVERDFYNRGALDGNYKIALYSTALLPLYNDSRIEVIGDINGKKIPQSILSCDSLSQQRVDPALVKELTEAFMGLRIKEIK